MMWCSARLVLLLVVGSTISSQVALPAEDSTDGEGGDDEGHFIDEFIVEVRGDNDVADLVAGTHGFRMLSHINGLGEVYRFQHSAVKERSKRSAEGIVEKLMSDPNVKNVVQQKIIKREKREIIYDKQIELPIKTYADKSVYQRYYHDDDKVVAKSNIPDGEKVSFSDPHFRDQWYLVNTGQTGGPVGLDVNVMPVWKKGITGKDVVVCILDDGIDHTHKDLKKNYDPKASRDLNDKNDKKNDPMPNISKAGNSHGTRCAGEVAAQADNDVCGVGIAYNSRIGGVRMLDGKVTDGLEAEALLFQNEYIDIYSASWGPRDNGKTMEAPGQYAKQALENGIKNGRNKLGSIFVWATGNGGLNHDTCSCDGYVSSIYTLSVGCIDDSGQSTYFTEHCPSTMAVIHTGGGHVPPRMERSQRPKLKVVTTDINEGCTLGFEGTSSAAPLAAGAFALVLEANPSLTWRDLQHIVVGTAKVTNSEPGWSINGAGKHVNHKFGFGALDVGRMVEMAQHWTTVAKQHICHVPTVHPNRVFGSGSTVEIPIITHGCLGDEAVHIDKLEHVEVHVKLNHSRRGDVLMYLVSPSGTRSRILQKRIYDDDANGIDFTFMTVFNWGENPVGRWILEVTDSPPAQSGRVNSGLVKSVTLTLYGTASPSREKKTGYENTRAYNPADRRIKQILNQEQKISKAVQINSGNEPTNINPLLKQRDEDATNQRQDTETQRKLTTAEVNVLYDAIQRRINEIDQRQRLLHNQPLNIAKKNHIPSENEASLNEDSDVNYDELLKRLLQIKQRGLRSQIEDDDEYQKESLIQKRENIEHVPPVPLNQNSPVVGEEKAGSRVDDRALLSDDELNTIIELSELLETEGHNEVKRKLREYIWNSRK